MACKPPKLSFSQRMAHEDSTREDLCPLGRCSKIDSNKREKCNGKIIEVYAQYSGDPTLYVEKECLKCKRRFGSRPAFDRGDI